MTGDRVQIENATLYHGDCRDILGDLSFDSILCDPPYGLGRHAKRSFDRFTKTRNLHGGGTWAANPIYKDIDWDEETPDLTFLLEQDVPMIIFGGNYFALPPSRKWIIWDKGEQFYHRTFAEAELAYCNFDGNTRICKCGTEFNSGFVHQKPVKVHPTQKPVRVMEYCISELPKDNGNVVCDPYMGSGTTGVACVNLGRAFIGIERKKKYFDIACQRIERAYAEYQNQFPEVRELIEAKLF
jgi:DNA modification methylase